MGLDVHFGDKLVPGVNNTITIRTDAKPGSTVRPEVKVKTPAGDLAFNLTRLDTTIWKVRFLLPKEAKGELELAIKSGSESKTEKKAIG